jgi:hypothetical protein
MLPINLHRNDFLPAWVHASWGECDSEFDENK